jgi:hypothetical protein
MNTYEPKTHPSLLTWMCIASLVAGVSWIAMYLALITFSITGNIPDGLFPGIVIEYLHAGYIFITAQILLSVIGISGVIMMWRMKKTGFYLYTIIKIIGYFLPVIVIGSKHLAFPGLLLTSVFITMYGGLFHCYPEKVKKKHI